MVVFYSPGEAVRRSGLGLDTLRYYERIGLLDRVARDPSGRRRFGENDLTWLRVLVCLRETGMPIAQMRRYAELVRGGEGTLGERVAARTVRAGIEGSLRRLGTGDVDLYYAHIVDAGTPLAETVAAFSALVTEGRARMVGCSNHPVGLLRRARNLAADEGLVPYRVIQQRYTYLRPRPGGGFGVQEPVTDELLDYVAGQPDMSLLGYSILLNGAYSRPDRPFPEEYDRPDAAGRLAVLHEVASEIGATPNQVVLSWLLHGEPPVMPIIGVSSVEQLHECLAAVDLDLDRELRERLDTA